MVLKMATENACIVNICPMRKIFTLYLQFCASLSILLKLVLRKNDIRDKKKLK